MQATIQSRDNLDHVTDCKLPADHTLPRPKAGSSLVRLATLVMLAIALRSFGGSLSVTSSLVPTGSVVNLTTLGALDWVHWGLNTEFAYDRKASVPPQLTVFAPTLGTLGSGPYQYSDNLNAYSWYDGLPNTIVTNTTTGIYVLAKGSGFQITAPADTTLRRLRIYVGSFGAQGELDASLSDNSASAYSDSSVDNDTNSPATVYTLTYAANSPGQTLTVTFAVKREHPNTDGNVTLQAATLAYAISNNPPSATLTNPINNSTFSIPTNISLSAIASDSDGIVSKVEFFQGNTKLGESTNAPYIFTWSNAPVGDFLLRAVATDNGGLSYTSRPVEIFVNGTGGALNGTASLAPIGGLDLTAEGTSDWAHWGLSFSNQFDHKTNVSSQIPNYNAIGTNSAQQFSGYSTVFNWTDGAPTISASTDTGISVPGLLNGFDFTVPAGTYPKTLKIYVGLYAAQGNFQAFLSDLSAPAYTDASLTSLYGNVDGMYALTFSSPASNATLRVRYTCAALYDSAFGNVTLEAATLTASPPPQPVTLLYPGISAGLFTFSFNTETNRTYFVEWSDSLLPGSWQPLTNMLGTGNALWITDPLTPRHNFYRVRIQ